MNRSDEYLSGCFVGLNGLTKSIDNASKHVLINLIADLRRQNAVAKSLREFESWERNTYTVVEVPPFPCGCDPPCFCQAPYWTYDGILRQQVIQRLQLSIVNGCSSGINIPQSSHRFSR